MDILNSILKERQNKLREETTDTSIESMISMFEDDAHPCQGLSEDDPCWKDYEQIGMKKKNGKKVPNCVPKEEVELDEALSPKDKKVIDAFYDGKDMDGKTVKSVGDKLETTGMGAQVVLKRQGNKFRIFGIIDSRRVQEIIRYIKKSYPKNTIIESVEEGKQVASFNDIADIVLNKVKQRLEKEWNKNTEKGLGMLNTLGSMVGYKATDKKQDKGKLFLKFGDVNEDAAVDGAELKAKQAGELERIKNRHETELEALTDKHEREQERIDGQKEKETADNAIKSKRDADRKKAEADADKKESYHMSTLNKLRKEK